MSRRIDEGAPGHVFLTPKEYFRQQYYEVLDLLSGEIDRRFNQEGIKILGQIESLLINACNGQVNQPSDTLESLYRADIDFQRLQVQLAMLPDLLKVVKLMNKIQLGLKLHK